MSQQVFLQFVEAAEASSAERARVAFQWSVQKIYSFLHWQFGNSPKCLQVLDDLRRWPEEICVEAVVFPDVAQCVRYKVLR